MKIEEGKVYVLRTLINKNGKCYGHFNVDMLMLDGVYFAIFEWENHKDGQRPKFFCEIDPLKLVAMNWKSCDFQYQGTGIDMPLDTPSHIPYIPENHSLYKPPQNDETP